MKYYKSLFFVIMVVVLAYQQAGMYFLMTSIETQRQEIERRFDRQEKTMELYYEKVGAECKEMFDGVTSQQTISPEEDTEVGEALPSSRQ
jgi:hypothetical protein